MHINAVSMRIHTYIFCKYNMHTYTHIHMHINNQGEIVAFTVGHALYCTNTTHIYTYIHACT
jgi:hypothetical protein